MRARARLQPTHIIAQRHNTQERQQSKSWKGHPHLESSDKQLQGSCWKLVKYLANWRREELCSWLLVHLQKYLRFPWCPIIRQWNEDNRKDRQGQGCGKVWWFLVFQFLSQFKWGCGGNQKPCHVRVIRNPSAMLVERLRTQWSAGQEKLCPSSSQVKVRNFRTWNEALININLMVLLMWIWIPCLQFVLF